MLEKFIPNSGRIVDLGCGHGIFTFLMAITSSKRKIIGIDILRERIESARRCAQQANLQNNVEFWIGDIRKDNIPESDAISIIDALCYFPFDVQLDIARRCFESLKNGGILLIKDFDRSPWWKYKLFCFQETLAITLRFISGEKTWKKFFRWKLFVWNAPEFKKKLEEIGFKVRIIPFHNKNYLSHTVYICKK